MILEFIKLEFCTNSKLIFPIKTMDLEFKDQIQFHAMVLKFPNTSQMPFPVFLEFVCLELNSFPHLFHDAIKQSRNFLPHFIGTTVDFHDFTKSFDWLF